MGKILVIDDNYDILNLMDTILTKNGYDVKVAHDGEEGIEQLNNDSNFKLVITDIRMPGKNGNHVAKYIRDHEKMHNKPVIALTAYAEEAEIELFDSILIKPIELNELIELIDMFL